MATRNVLGKIAAVVSINTGSVRPTLNSTAKDVERFATTVRSRISSATRASGKAFDDIFTPLQKLQAALKAANQQPVDLKIQNGREIQQAVRAAEQIAKPLANARKEFGTLSQGVQASLLPVLQSAQKQATNLFDALSNGAKVSNTDLANTEARVQQLISAFSRAAQASQLIRGLGNGQELQFQNPEFVEQARRSAQLQQQASSLTASQLSGSSIVNLIGQQRAAADEAERLRATLDKVRTTRNGDAAAAQAAYSNQLAQLANINNRIEFQIDLIRRSAAARASAPGRAEDNEIALLIRREQAAKQLEVERQAAAQRVADNEIALLQRREQAAKQLEERRQADIDRATDNEIAALIRREQAAKRLEEQRLGQSTDLPPDYFQRGFESQIRGELGPAITDQQRQFDVLRGSIVSVKGQLDTLPAGVRSQFIPAIQQAEAEFQRLRALGPDATAEAVENAANEVDRLGQQLRRVSQVQALPNFADSLNETSLRGAIGNLNALQQILARVGAEAGSNAAVQFDRMRAAIQRATADGTIGSQAFQNELREIARDAAAAAAETRRIGQGAAFREIQRGGDVARGGFDRLSLAANQAAFAIDDFFSVQGDFSQRIRAVQNNVTQLAFILDGTRGLFVALGVAIAAQAAIAIVRFYNEGRTAEDQTKALNDALARQKSLVEELAQAFDSLGDSIAGRAFSESAQQARDFRKQIEEIAKKQQELRESNVVDLNPDVQRERANQNVLRRELESESDIGRRTAIEAQIRASRDRERQLAEAALQNRPSARDVVGAIEEARRVVEFDRSRRTSADPREFTPEARERRRREAVAGIDVNAAANDADSLLAQRRALERQIADLTEDATRRDVGGSGSGPENVRAAEQRNRLEGLLASIELPIQKAIDELSNKILESSFGLSLAIEQAQDDVADAIRRGVSGAADFQAALDNTAKQLEAAQNRLENAQEIEDPEQRREQVRRAEAEVRDLELRRDVINEQSREVRLTTGRGGARTEAALSAVQGNERFANEYGRLIARLRDVIDRETKARSELDQAIAKNDEAAQAVARAELDAASAASDLAAATAEAALAMEQALTRIRKIGDDALRGSEQIADDAQKRFTEDPTAENRRERDAAEQQLIRDRERVAVANNALDRARSEALRLNDPEMVRINTELEQIARERKRLSDESAQTGVLVDPRDAERLANREAQLQSEREERLRQLTQGERANLDAIAQEIAAREKMIAALEKQRAFDEEVERRRNPRGDALRGLDLAETPGQRAARETEQGILDIDAAFREQGRRLVNDAGGLFDIDAAEQQLLNQNEAARQAAIRRFAADQQRAAAPAIFGLADSVANAVLQGPSRAALNVSDISTDEGARELNRLLRGEDSARDQNLIELQKQSTELAQVNTKLTALANRVGVAL